MRSRNGHLAWHTAAAVLSKAFLELLLPYTPDVDVRTVPGVEMNGQATPAYAETALHIAARYGCHESCYFLLKNRASPTAVDSTGRTPLHEAASAGQLTCLRFLLRMGDDPRLSRAQVNAVDEDGWSAL
jgi:ankyrin repeat protein